MLKRFLLVILAYTVAMTLDSCAPAADKPNEDLQYMQEDLREEEAKEKPAEEGVTDKVEEDNDEETEVAAIGEKESKAEDTETEKRNVEMDEEMTGIYETLLTWEYNGFLASEYEDPEHIGWNEVFYLGELAENEKYRESYGRIRDAYADGSEEMRMDIDDFGIDIFDGKVIREFVKGTTGGLSPEDLKSPLDLTYLEEWDVYVDLNASDINLVGVTVRSYEKDADGVYTIEYDNWDSPFTVKLKKNGDYLQFISNRWTPAEGRQEASRKLYNEEVARFDFAPRDLCGYHLRDIDGDGVDELFIGKMSDDNIYWLSSIKMGRTSYYYTPYKDSNDSFRLADDDTLYWEHFKSDGSAELSHYETSSYTDYTYLVFIDGVSKEKGEGSDEWDEYRTRAERSFVDIDLIPLSDW